MLMPPVCPLTPSEVYQIEKFFFCRCSRSFEPFELKKNLCYVKIAQDNLRFGGLR